MTDFGKPHIDFSVYNSNDPKYLVIGDSSDYKDSLKNNTSTLSIKLPGSSTYQLFPWAKNKLNRFNSNTLHLSCVQPCVDQAYLDLPDGIYSLLLQVSPNDIYFKEHYYLKTDVFRIALDKIYIRADIDYNPNQQQLREDLSVIEFMLRTAEAYTRDGNFAKANRCFSEAQRIKEKYAECTNCI